MRDSYSVFVSQLVAGGLSNDLSDGICIIIEWRLAMRELFRYPVVEIINFLVMMWR